MTQQQADLTLQQQGVSNIPMAPNPDIMLPWVFNKDGSENNRHNVRVLCDLKGLTLHKKNVITACIEVESDFNPNIDGRPNANGTTDHGICQFNDGKLHGVPLWIGPGAAFAFEQEVESNPTKCVNLMIDEFEAGHASWWMSYSEKKYLEFMPNGETASYYA